MNEQAGALYTVSHEVDGITDTGVISNFDVVDGKLVFDGFSFLERRAIHYTLDFSSHYVLRIFYPSFDSSRSKGR